MLANHFHLRLMTMLMKILNGYKRLHFSDPLNGVSKQNLVKTSLSKIVSKFDQEIPQSQTADNPVALRGRAAQPSRVTRKTN